MSTLSKAFIPLLLIALSGCSTSATPVTLDPRGDAIIATRIKAKLIDNETVDAAAVYIDSDRGTVTLSGFVESAEVLQTVETIARAEPDVVEVVNRLVVQ